MTVGYGSVQSGVPRGGTEALALLAIPQQHVEAMPEIEEIDPAEVAGAADEKPITKVCASLFALVRIPGSDAECRACSRRRS